MGRGKDKYTRRSGIRRLEARKHVINDLLSGGVYSVIIDKLVNDAYDIEYNYSVKSAQEIIKEARDVIKADYEEQRGQIKEQLIAILNDLLTECREYKDRNSAIKTVQEIAKLTGAYEPEKIEAKIDEDINIDFKFDNNNIDNNNIDNEC